MRSSIQLRKDKAEHMLMADAMQPMALAVTCSMHNHPTMTCKSSTVSMPLVAAVQQVMKTRPTTAYLHSV